MSDMADACPKCGWVPGKLEYIKAAKHEAFQEEQARIAAKNRWLIIIVGSAILFLITVVILSIGH